MRLAYSQILLINFINTNISCRFTITTKIVQEYLNAIPLTPVTGVRLINTPVTGIQRSSFNMGGPCGTSSSSHHLSSVHGSASFSYIWLINVMRTHFV